MIGLTHWVLTVCTVWQVEVRAELWALNFRDVLVATGAIPTEVR